MRERAGRLPVKAVIFDIDGILAVGARAVSMHAIHDRDFEDFSRELARLADTGA